MDSERNKDPGILISSLIDCVSDLTVQLSEDLGDAALDMAEKGNALNSFIKVEKNCNIFLYCRCRNN